MGPVLNRRQWGVGMAALGLGRMAGAQTAPRELPKEVRIGFQKGSAILLLARKQQVVETRLKALGVPSVKCVEFQFGPPMLEALGAGVIDLGSVGDTPPIFAQAGGSNLVYAAATPSAQHAVLVPKNSPLKTLADLKGKKVAFGKGSSAHNVTVKALAQAGLGFQDIVPTYLSPADATAAFNGGNIDAWVVWDPYQGLLTLFLGSRRLLPTVQSRRVTPHVRLPMQGAQRRVGRGQEPSLRVAGHWGRLRRCPRLQGISLAAPGRLASSPNARQRDPQK